IDQHVNSAEVLECSSDRSLDMRSLLKVACDGKYCTTPLPQVFFGTGQLLHVPRQQHHFPAMTANLSRDYQTETARSAADQKDFVTNGKLFCSNHAEDRPSGDNDRCSNDE